MDIAQGLGSSARSAIYTVPDNELAVGSTLGSPTLMTIVKATGALERVYDVASGVDLGGMVPTLHRHAAACRCFTLAQHPGKGVGTPALPAVECRVVDLQEPIHHDLPLGHVLTVDANIPHDVESAEDTDSAFLLTIAWPLGTVIESND